MFSGKKLSLIAVLSMATAPAMASDYDALITNVFTNSTIAFTMSFIAGGLPNSGGEPYFPILRPISQLILYYAALRPAFIQANLQFSGSKKETAAERVKAVIDYIVSLGIPIAAASYGVLLAWHYSGLENLSQSYLKEIILLKNAR